MNQFEKEVQDKSNDVIPSGLGFVYSFVFFALIFTIATLVDVFSAF